MPPSIPNYPKFVAGTYRVQGIRWFGRGRVLARELQTGCTAPVPGILPGEQADVRIDDGLLRNGRVIDGSLTSRSPWRVDPPCSQAAICPGCALQHVSKAGREDYHKTLIHEVLDRFGGFEALPEVRVHAGIAGDHRARTRLWIRRPGGANVAPEPPWSVGMRQTYVPDGPLVDFSRCLANTPILRAAADRLRTLPIGAEQWAGWGRDSPQIELAWDGATLEITVPDDQSTFRDRVLAHLVSSPAAVHAPVVLSNPNTPWRAANPAMQRSLVEYVCTRRDWRDMRVFDLTCGEGQLAIALARAGARVWASDRHWPAVLRTRERARARGLAELKTRGGEALAVLKGAAKRGEIADAIVINPMREPIGDAAMDAAHQSAAHTVVYLAPAPKAGAKDLGVLRRHGWTIFSCDAFVLHPWAGKPMLVAQMQRAPSTAS